MEQWIVSCASGLSMIAEPDDMVGDWGEGKSAENKD